MPPLETPPDRQAAPSLRRSALAELGLGVAWLIGIAATLQLLDAMLGQAMLGAAIAGAVLVDLACSWAGVRWDTGERRAWKEATSRVAVGAGIAALLTAVTLALTAALGASRVSFGHPLTSVWSFAVVAIRSAAIGVRDELLFRGLPLTAAARAGVPQLGARVFAALTGAAAIALVPGVSPAAIALNAGSGLLFATLWQLDRGAWSAVGAHGALAFLTSALARGGLLDVTLADGNLTLGPKAAGAPAWLAAGAALALALALPRLPSFRAPRSPDGRTPSPDGRTPSPDGRTPSPDGRT
jgi:hypothetical protein